MKIKLSFKNYMFSYATTDLQLNKQRGKIQSNLQSSVSLAA